MEFKLKGLFIYFIERRQWTILTEMFPFDALSETTASIWLTCICSPFAGFDKQNNTNGAE